MDLRNFHTKNISQHFRVHLLVLLGTPTTRFDLWAKEVYQNSRNPGLGYGSLKVPLDVKPCKAMTYRQLIDQVQGNNYDLHFFPMYAYDYVALTWPESREPQTNLKVVGVPKTVPRVTFGIYGKKPFKEKGMTSIKGKKVNVELGHYGHLPFILLQNHVSQASGQRGQMQAFPEPIIQDLPIQDYVSVRFFQNALEALLPVYFAKSPAEAPVCMISSHAFEQAKELNPDIQFHVEQIEEISFSPMPTLLLVAKVDPTLDEESDKLRKLLDWSVGHEEVVGTMLKPAQVTKFVSMESGFLHGLEDEWRYYLKNRPVDAAVDRTTTRGGYRQTIGNELQPQTR
jgi:hypothetical protein